MKAVCAVLCLGLLSVCRAAPLTCDQLLTTQDQELDFAGRWYLHAMSTDSCAFSHLMHTLMKPSIMVDAVRSETAQTFEVVTTFKIQSFCMNDTEAYSFDKTSLTYTSFPHKYHLLPSSCSDCTVLKTEGLTKIILLYSRKPSVDAADLKEFETQASCLGLPQPKQFDNDYEMSNCKDIEEDEPTSEEGDVFIKRAEDFLRELIQCFVRYVYSLIKPGGSEVEA
ncbi:hypothetical protein NQD34_003872 [Periophthalmus magnuspinnatus]|uniref:uncharacterized protein LOC129456281 n=1 Tax=Periophthalmus magnuspinnatus TaxID=409849 RepID=UPI0022CC2AE8|nr:uncharacterized protein LOC129456281 [Periophthalmus magnuspinnatus]KAJ0023973.1 hypothetical protein NQD34_003872 [Periophthalmus magnuspinnatus]